MAAVPLGGCSSSADANIEDAPIGWRSVFLNRWSEVRVLPGPPPPSWGIDFAGFFVRIVPPVARWDNFCSLFELRHPAISKACPACSPCVSFHLLQRAVASDCHDLVLSRPALGEPSRRRLPKSVSGAVWQPR